MFVPITHTVRRLDPPRLRLHVRAVVALVVEFLVVSRPDGSRQTAISPLLLLLLAYEDDDGVAVIDGGGCGGWLWRWWWWWWWGWWWCYC